ncbi:MAG: DNA polymerase I [Gemmatimonadales bacterium]
MSRPRLFLVDGYALIYRAFFAMIGRPLTTSRGENTSAVWGVANFLLRLVDRHAPAYVAWVHDAGSSGRVERYPAYKATREKLEPELQEAFDTSVDRVRQLLDAFRVTLVELPGWEADDIIATMAYLAPAAGLDTVIVSGDKDLYQLIGPQVALLNPGRGGPAAVDEQWVDMTNAAERLGVPPDQVVDYLALVGDSSDNVPGVKGIGDKTARALLAEYGTLDTILARAAEVTGKRPREALLAQGEQALLSRELVTLRRDAPVSLDLERLAATTPDRPRVAALFSELEFHSLLPRIAADPAPSVALVVAQGTDTGIQVVSDARALAAALQTIRAGEVPVLRTWPDSGDPMRVPLAGLAIASPTHTWYLPVAHRAPSELGVVDPKNLPADARRILAAWLDDPATPTLVHDGKRDRHALDRASLALRGDVTDVMLADFMLDPGRRAYDLPTLALERLGVELVSRSALTGSARDRRAPEEIPPQDVATALAAEAEAVRRLWEAQRPELERQNLLGLLHTLDLPLAEVLWRMERRGMAIDAARLADLSRQLGQELRALEREVVAAAGTEFNLNSVPQLRHVLFEKLQLPVLKKTKTGASTDADVLQELADMGFDVPKRLLEYRELEKLRSAYVDALPAHVNPATGRIHTTFLQTGAATGRLSSTEPNLQNIAVRTSRGGEIRRCFLAAPGRQLIVGDYSQVELRILAHLSGDEVFIAAFRRGGDIHRETASLVFDVPVDDVTPDMRARAKTINFATIYGQGAFSLARQLGITQDEARHFISTYFERLSGVRRFLDETIARARETGYVETILGRRRYIPELQDRNRSIRSFGERAAMNAPMQGSAADLIKVAMLRLDAALAERGLDAAMLLQVHDELVLEAAPDAVDATATLVRELMQGAAELAVPLVVDVGVGPNWLEAKA